MIGPIVYLVARHTMKCYWYNARDKSNAGRDKVYDSITEADDNVKRVEEEESLNTAANDTKIKEKIYEELQRLD